jgi:hypothetical protein
VANALSSRLGRLENVSVDLPDGGRIADSAGDAVSAGTDAASDTLDAGKDAAKDASKKVKGLRGKLLGDD